MYSKVWSKAIDNALDRTDVALLNELTRAREYTPDQLAAFAEATGVSQDEVARRIGVLRQKNIVLGANRTIVNPIKLWNNYIYVLVKAGLQPPVVGMDVDYPTGWSDMMKRIVRFQGERGIDVIRVAHALHGIGGYDLLLILSLNDLDVMIEMMESLSREGWIDKAETFRPNEYEDLYIYDPVSVPTTADFDAQVADVLREYERRAGR